MDTTKHAKYEFYVYSTIGNTVDNCANGKAFIKSVSESQITSNSPPEVLTII